MNCSRWAVRRCVERADVCAVGQSAGIGEGNRIEGLEGCINQDLIRMRHVDQL